MGKSKKEKSKQEESGDRDSVSFSDSAADAPQTEKLTRKDYEEELAHIDAAFLTAAIANISEKLAFVCGPSPMMESVTDALLSLGVPPSSIRSEAFGTEKRNPTRRTAAAGRSIGTAAFSLSNVAAPVHVGDTILNIAERAGLTKIESACRSGSCGLRRAKLLVGDAPMASDEALAPEERAEGYVLSCQAEARGDLVVEA